MLNCFASSLPLCELVYDSARSHIIRTMSTLSFTYSFYEDIPTLDEVKLEISKIIGLPNVKPQLKSIVKKIIAAEKQTNHGGKLVPPRPFHMVFVGNSGTGKSMVSRILGKLFYLSGVLPSYHVSEMQGVRGKIKQAEGGVLLVDVDQNEYNSDMIERIVTAMDEGKTSVIFAGPREALNRCITLNKELYKKFAVMLQFDDFSCEELALLLQNKMDDEDEDNAMQGFELHPCCSIETVEKIIAEETDEEVRSQLNAYLIEPFLTEAKNNVNRRVCAHSSDQTMISPQDLQEGIRTVNQLYKKLLGL